MKKIEVKGRQYAVEKRKDERIQVTRIAPYDETEYHWALSTAGGNGWQIIRNKKVFDTFHSNDPYEAALACTVWDDSMHLKRTGGIN